MRKASSKNNPYVVQPVFNVMESIQNRSDVNSSSSGGVITNCCDHDHGSGRVDNQARLEMSQESGRLALEKAIWLASKTINTPSFF